MATLIIYLDSCVRSAQRPDFPARTAFDHAFGAVQYHAYLFPNDSLKLAKLWDEVYKPKFEEILYGV